MLRDNLDKIRTVVKFISNPQSNRSINTLITKTTKKIGLINADWLMSTPETDQPVAGDFWLVDVMSEIHQREPRGCLLLNPVSHVPVEDISYLLPGMYFEHVLDGILILVPKNVGPNWIITRQLKNAAMDRFEDRAVAVIVSTEGKIP